MGVLTWCKKPGEKRRIKKEKEAAEFERASNVASDIFAARDKKEAEEKKKKTNKEVAEAKANVSRTLDAIAGKDQPGGGKA